MNWNLKKYIKLRGVQILALGFVVIILVLARFETESS